eukprot:Partr_v1_DN28341_c2_g2_i1_m78734 putative Tubulin, gamma complex associated protein 2
MPTKISIINLLLTARARGACPNPPNQNSKIFPMEATVCSEVLLMMMGYSGVYLKKTSSQLDSASALLFEVDSSLDQSLRVSVQKFLPMGTYYTIIQAYVDEFSSHSHGYVHHALAGALRSLLEDFLLFVAEAEVKLSQPLTEGGDTFPGLGSLNAWSQPTIQRMKSLAELVVAIGACGNASSEISSRGGPVLGVLYDHWIRSAGDPKTKALFSHLLSQCSKPYLQIMMDWISTGSLEDPYDEFFVLQRSSRIPADGMVEWWWQNSFVMRGSEVKKPEEIFSSASQTSEELLKKKMMWVPAFLRDDVDKILNSGKCWHLLTACGKSLPAGGEDIRLQCNINDLMRIGPIVDSWHRKANKELLRVLFEDYEMLPKLRCIKHFFFLSQSDYLTLFLDTALPVLRQPAGQLSAVKLQSLLDLAIKSSSGMALAGLHRGLIPGTTSSEDAIKVELSKYAFVDMLVRIITVNSTNSDSSFSLNDLNIADTSKVSSSRMTGLQTFTLNIDIQFPLSVIISRKSLTKYQLVFRQLFLLKSVERLLCSAWIDHQVSARIFSKWCSSSSVSTAEKEQLKECLRMAWLLRARMCSLIQGLLSFVTDRLETQSHILFNFLLEVRFAVLNDKDDEIKNLDEVIHRHDTFLDTSLKECLVTNKKLVLVLSFIRIRILD